MEACIMSEPRKARPLDKSLYGTTPFGHDPAPKSGTSSIRRRWQAAEPLETEPRRWADAAEQREREKGRGTREAGRGEGERTRRPLIGINCDLMEQAGTEYCWLPDRYIQCLDAAGAELVILAPYTGLAAPCSLLDGLVMISGHDLDPRNDGYQLHPSQVLMHPRRERFDRRLVAEAARKKIPLLAIGTGMQTLNVVMGGTLYFHLPEEFPKALPHLQADDREHGHPIYVREGSLLHRCYPETLIGHVRSRHHQAVDDVAEGFAATAWAEPGIIEAIESTGAPGTPGHGWPAVGVQWHPEVVEAIATDRLLFDEFVCLCADWRK